MELPLPFISRRLHPSGCVFHERSGSEPFWLFLHGNGCDSADWGGVWKYLPGSWRLVALDFRGHGESETPSSQVSFEHLADDVCGLLQHLGGRWFLAGHSLGGMAAMRVASQMPESVAGLALAEGWTNLARARRLSEGFWGELSDRQCDAIRRKSDATFSRWPIGLWEGYWASVEAADASGILARTDLPIVELYGNQGHPPLPRGLLGIPDRANIEVRWAEGAGHYLPIERPEFVAGAIKDLCKEQHESHEAPQPLR